jgi:hypothetical protein
MFVLWSSGVVEEVVLYHTFTFLAGFNTNDVRKVGGRS